MTGELVRRADESVRRADESVRRADESVRRADLSGPPERRVELRCPPGLRGPAYVLILCLPLLVGLVAAQSQTPVFKAGVDLVQLDVSVLDKHRQPIRGLTQ